MAKKKLSIEELVKRIEDKTELLEKQLEEKKAENERHKSNIKKINRKISRSKKMIKEWTEEKNRLEAIGLVEVLNEKGMSAQNIEKALKNNDTGAISQEIRAGEQRKAEEARKAEERRKAAEEEEKTKTEEKEAVESVEVEDKIESLEPEERFEEASEDNKRKRGIFGRK